MSAVSNYALTDYLILSSIYRTSFKDFCLSKANLGTQPSTAETLHKVNPELYNKMRIAAMLIFISCTHRSYSFQKSVEVWKGPLKRSRMITVFQKNWALTDAAARKDQIFTGSFGPCYVITFTNPRQKVAALAHVDDTTNVDSLNVIIKEFEKRSIAPKEIRVIVMGGWRDHPESAKWGNKVLKTISSYGFQKVNVKHMYSKKIFAFHKKLSREEVASYYYYGAFVDAASGKTYFIQKFVDEIEEAQVAQMKKLYAEYGNALEILDIQFPLTRTT